MDTARDVTLRLQDLLRRERFAMGDFLVALADLDRRRLWVDLGYASLFDYLRRELGLSKASAFFRMKAAGLIQRFPDLGVPLRDGRLCLTSVAELAKVLTEENKDDVLPRFFLLSKREAKEVAAAIRPDEAPPRRDVVTAARPAAEPPRLELAASRTRTPTREATFSLGVVRPDEPTPPAGPPAAVPHPMGTPPAPPSTVEPLSAELIRIHLTASKRIAEKLARAKDALSHSHPGAGIADILEAGLDLLLERDAKRKGLVKKPLATPRPSSNPDHVPAHVRRAVWKRDGGRCQFRLVTGEICGSTLRLEIDHVTPRAMGGPSTLENCRLACETHNDRAARRVFGDAWMDRFTRNPRAGAAPVP